MPSLEKKARNSEELRQWQEVARGFVGAIKGHFSPYGPNYGEYREFKWGFWHEAIERVRSSQELADLIKGWINERKAKNPTAWAGFNEPKIS